jgi:cob(I)alamin adenosyltransferase
VDDLLMTQHTVSRVCHNIANDVNVIQFILDDLMSEATQKNIQEGTVKHLVGQVDALSMSMDFFRNLYSPANSKNNVLKIARNICRFREVRIPEISQEILSQIPSHRVEKSIAVILFLLAKLKKRNLEIEMKILGNSIGIMLRTFDIDLQKSLHGILCQISECSEPNHENILVYYAQKLVSIDGYFFKVNNVNDSFEIMICKKDSV